MRDGLCGTVFRFKFGTENVAALGLGGCAPNKWHVGVHMPYLLFLRGFAAQERYRGLFPLNRRLMPYPSLPPWLFKVWVVLSRQPMPLS